MRQSITAKAWCERYLTERGTGWSDITRKSYHYLVRCHIVPGIGEIALEQLTSQRIQRFYDWLARGGLGGYSIRCVHLLLRRCLDEACRAGLLQQNPAKSCQVPQTEPVPGIPLRLGQIQRYLMAAEKQRLLPLTYLNKDGIRSIKSVLTNQIFRQELYSIYQKKSQSRDELVRESRKALQRLAEQLTCTIADHPMLEIRLQELAQRLETVKGKKVYGYLPKDLKCLVDEAVDSLCDLPAVRDCYDRWLLLQEQVESYYHDKPLQRLPLSKQKELKAIKNAVIQQAESIRLGEISFEDSGFLEQDEPQMLPDTSPDYGYLCYIITSPHETLEVKDNAVREMAKLADAGDPNAQYRMGQLYRNSSLVIPDGVVACDWFAKAAEQGHVAAQYALGKLCFSRDTEVRDTTQGMYWLKQAAQGGSLCAAYFMGREYLRGKSVPKDIPKALKLFRQAADGGNPYAQYMLGKLCLMGKGVPEDREQAHYWFTQSARQGNDYAQYFLDRWDSLRPPSLMLAGTRLLRQLGGIFRENSLPPSQPGAIELDRKRIRQLREKAQAAGRKYSPTMQM